MTLEPAAIGGVCIFTGCSFRYEVNSRGQSNCYLLLDTHFSKFFIMSFKTEFIASWVL